MGTSLSAEHITDHTFQVGKFSRFAILMILVGSAQNDLELASGQCN